MLLKLGLALSMHAVDVASPTFPDVAVFAFVLVCIDTAEYIWPVFLCTNCIQAVHE